MKIKSFLLALAALIFIITGCTDSSLFTERESAPALKSAALKNVPITWDINVMLTEFGLYNGHPTPIGGGVQGIVSHLGKLDEESSWIATTYERHDDVELPYIDYVITGNLVAANGDVLHLTTEGKLYPHGNEDGLNWSAKMYFTGGTGRFENVIGEGDGVGSLFYNENGIPVNVAIHLVGELSSVGSTK